MIPAPAIEAPGTRFCVRVVDDKPVATSAVYIDGRVAGISFVTTFEAFRRRGIGQAMTEYALCEGIEAGRELAHLEAEAAARRIYERMGFRIVATYAECRAPG
jgi:ribosomal protein S18 acetylase RimI-like enzyme